MRPDIYTRQYRKHGSEEYLSENPQIQRHRGCLLWCALRLKSYIARGPKKCMRRHFAGYTRWRRHNQPSCSSFDSTTQGDGVDRMNDGSTERLQAFRLPDHPLIMAPLRFGADRGATLLDRNRLAFGMIHRRVYNPGSQQASLCQVISPLQVRSDCPDFRQRVLASSAPFNSSI